MGEQMTIIYNKRLGSIRAAVSGEQSVVTMFGEEGEDYSLIYSELILEYDPYVLNNTYMFKVNVDTLQLEMKPEYVTKYPVATE